jgi:hypothetical protein
MNRLKQFLLQLLGRQSHKELAVENKTEHIYTEEQLMARLKFFIGICLSLTLFGIVFVVLYSLIFVTQPLNAISPIDQKFFELIIPIATFLTGTLSGIMLASPGDKEAQKAALEAANKGWDKPPTPVATTSSKSSSGGFGSAPAFGATPTSSFGNNVPVGFGAPADMPPAFGGFGQQGNSQTFAMTASGKRIVPEEPQPEL